MVVPEARSAEEEVTGCFVRLLFGDSLIDGYDGLLGDVAQRANDVIRPEPCRWFVCGENNAEVVSRSGCCPVLLHQDAVPNDTGQVDPDYVYQYGAARWGRNLYYLKFQAVRRAMEMGYGDVVFLDLDVEQARPLPPDFWDVLRSGQPIRAPFVQYHRKQCFWRKRLPRTSIYCATSYYRGLEVVDKCLAFADKYPKEYEQAAINWTMDELAGGEQKTQQDYRDKGFEFPYTEQRGGAIFRPIEPVFRIGSKGYSSWKRRGRAAWAAHVMEVVGG